MSKEKIILLKERWYKPKNAKVKVDFLDNERITISSDESESYLIYGENNGFNHPPQDFLDELIIANGKYRIHFSGVVNGQMNALLYLLIYNNEKQLYKFQIKLNESIDINLEADCYFKLAIKVSGSGEVVVNNIDIFSHDTIDAQILEEMHEAIKFKPHSKLEALLPRNHNKHFEQVSYEIVSEQKFTFRGYDAVQYQSEIRWLDDLGRGRAYLRLLNGFVWLGDIIEQLKASKDLQLLEGSYRIIEHWIDENPFEAKTQKMNWHDETTALRLLYLIAYFNILKPYDNKRHIQKIYCSIVEHAYILNRNDFYAGNNNHGMFQSFSLLVFSHSFPGNEEREWLKEKVKYRLIEYFNLIISNEGVHKEHTPVYHYLIASNLKKYGNAFLEIDEHFGQYLLQFYQKTERYSIHCLKPNGYYPQIGDNENKKPLKIGYEDLYVSNEYKYAITSGLEGRKPSVNDMVFAESGYAIFRDDWSLGEKATYLLFTAAYHTDYHKHSDDLSFLLYSGGDIIIDSGPNGYDYKKDETQYSYSSFGHNTLLVDGNGLPRVDDQYEKTQIINYSIDDNCSEVVGVNNRYEGVAHQRKLKYFKNDNKIEIVDSIESLDTHRYDLLYHFAKDIEPIVLGNQVCLYRDKLLVAVLKFESKSAFTLKLHFGKQSEGNIHGMYFDRFNHRTDTYVLNLNCKEKTATIQTQIIIISEGSLDETILTATKKD